MDVIKKKHWWQSDALKWSVLGLLGLLVGYLVVLMYAQGEYLFAITTLILSSAGLYIFANRKAYAWRYVYPGMAGMGLFVLFPLVCTIAIAPTKLTYKNGVLIASIISLLICPWKLMENQDSIYLFLDIIGGMLGPVIGVMMAHYFVVMRGQINLDELYTAPGDYKYYDNGFNLTAFSVTLVAVILSLGGKFIPFMEPLSRVSWFVGVIVAFAAYALLKKRTTAEKTGEQKTIG